VFSRGYRAKLSVVDAKLDILSTQGWATAFMQHANHHKHVLRLKNDFTLTWLQDT
jgi:hypothetical protein